MIKSFPKIFHLGDRYSDGIFNDEVEITEKVDGSQFSFGKIKGELFIRSKGANILKEVVPKMFQIAVDYVYSIVDRIPDETIFYCEYLNKPKHNVLAYDRIPKNNLILFGVCTPQYVFLYPMQSWADQLGIEMVPVLFTGKIDKIDNLTELLDRQSILGGQKIEGIVVKNYNRSTLIGGMILPITSAKYVSEKFKEVHERDWKRENTGKGKWEVYCSQFKSESRWLKAIQHLKERNEWTQSPKDIGNLLKEIQTDISREEKENIKSFLWKEFSHELLKTSVRGFPEWYKEWLLKETFREEAI